MDPVQLNESFVADGLDRAIRSLHRSELAGAVIGLERCLGLLTLEQTQSYLNHRHQEEDDRHQLFTDKRRSQEDRAKFRAEAAQAEAWHDVLLVERSIRTGRADLALHMASPEAIATYDRIRGLPV